MEFSLKFPLEELDHWASRYSYQEDEPIMAIAKAVQQRGHYTKEEFLRLCTWKSARIVPRCKRNDADFVEYATGIALSRDNHFERLRIAALTSLEGVDWPVASV